MIRRYVIKYTVDDISDSRILNSSSLCKAVLDFSAAFPEVHIFEAFEL